MSVTTKMSHKKYANCLDIELGNMIFLKEKPMIYSITNFFNIFKFKNNKLNKLSHSVEIILDCQKFT